MWFTRCAWLCQKNKKIALNKKEVTNYIIPLFASLLLLLFVSPLLLELATGTRAGLLVVADWVLVTWDELVTEVPFSLSRGTLDGGFVSPVLLVCRGMFCFKIPSITKFYLWRKQFKMLIRVQHNDKSHHITHLIF